MPIASPALARTLEIFKLRRMTLETLMTRKPTPVMLEPEAPAMVVSAVTLITVSPVMAPETKQTAATSWVAHAVSSARLVTIVVAAEPPPVVPPFWVA